MTDYQGLPQQLPDYGGYETFDQRLQRIGIRPADRYVMDRISLGRQSTIVRKGLTAAINEGESISKIGEQSDLAQAMDALNQFVEKTAGQTSKEYNDIRAALEAEVKNQTELPQRAGLQAPSVAQAIFAALGAMANPNYAFEIGATPFNEQLRQQGIEQGQVDQQFQLDQKSRQERIGLMSDDLKTQGAMDEREWRAKYNSLMENVQTQGQAQRTRREQEGQAERTRMEQEGLNYRADLTAAGRTDKNKVEQFKTMWKDAGPEGRKQLASMFSTDPNFQAAFGELTPKEREIESKIDLTKEKIKTENDTRQPKIDSINATTEQKKAQTEKLKMEVKLMPEKHQKAMQDIESRITERKRKREKGIGIDESAEAKDLQAKEKMLGEAYDRVTRYDPSLGMRVPKPGMEARAKQLESLLNDIADEMIENDFQIPMKPPPANLRQTENRLSGTIGSKAKAKPKGSQSYNDLMNKYGK